MRKGGECITEGFQLILNKLEYSIYVVCVCDRGMSIYGPLYKTQLISYYNFIS